ncbi:hypothetical protein [Sphingobium yanoikuyae]|jgi:hypothetical protein|uniref:hypothetical protein n=1 Tax=Sphingobium yanoikuyae TaxID=13690 RepID=UPI001F39FD78|nr:hypothetical protein [Sphingobium yanoikuyae]
MHPNAKIPCTEPDQQKPVSPIVRQAGYPDILVQTLEQASRGYCERRDQTGLGASAFPEAELMRDGVIVGRISYNGRIWHPIPWRPGDRPIYDNAACHGGEAES